MPKVKAVTVETTAVTSAEPITTIVEKVVFANDVFANGHTFKCQSLNLKDKVRGVKVTLNKLDKNGSVVDTVDLYNLNFGEVTGEITEELLVNKMADCLHSVVYHSVLKLPQWSKVDKFDFKSYKSFGVEVVITHTSGFNDKLINFIHEVVSIVLMSVKLHCEAKVEDLLPKLTQAHNDALFGKLKDNHLTIDGALSIPLLSTMGWHWIVAEQKSMAEILKLIDGKQ